MFLHDIVITLFIYYYYICGFMSRSRLYSPLRRIGNGRGILLSKSICSLVGIEIGDEVLVDIEGEKIILIPKRRGEDER